MRQYILLMHRVHRYRSSPLVQQIKIKWTQYVTVHYAIIAIVDFVRFSVYYRIIEITVHYESL